MTFAERFQCVREVYKYLRDNPTTATQKEICQLVNKKHDFLPSRKTFQRLLDDIRECYHVVIEYNNGTHSYITRVPKL